MPDTLTAEQWQRRALRAEAAVRHALWIRPMAYQHETAEQMATRFRLHLEATYPDLSTRYEHRPIEVFKWADSCGCDPDGPGYEADHAESDASGEALCSRSPLGRVCDSCRDEDGDGPEWSSYAVLWPCPPITALDAPAAAATVEG